jgi:hypothetical protein
VQSCFTQIAVAERFRVQFTELQKHFHACCTDVPVGVGFSLRQVL